MKIPLTFAKVLSWIVTIIVPVVLTLLAVRIVMNPWYVEFEYRTPFFPQDQYGFTREERLKYSKIAIAYLLNNADISFLGDLRFPEGQQAPDFSCQFMDDCTKFYNDRELGHMLDVKMVVQGALKVLYAGVVILVLLGLWAWFGKWWGDISEWAQARRVADGDFSGRDHPVRTGGIWGYLCVLS